MTPYEPATQDLSAARLPLGDQLSIATPELVAIEFPLAGLGSRFVAILLDYLLQGAAVILLIIIVAIVSSGVHTGTTSTPSSSPNAAKWGIAIVIAIPFLLEWGYFSLFEAFWRGQTPGKRVMHIRVIQQTGRPISLFESLGRNLVRIVDWLPAFYIVGIIAMFVTRRQQRLGDLIAGTLVVHERPLERTLESIGSSRTFTSASFQYTPTPPPPRVTSLPADAVAHLTLADLQALEHYLARRLDMSFETRTTLAEKIARRIAQKMEFSIPVGMSQETFLEETAYALRGLPNLKR
jgi:uncharacterized RDD family membrane protein YckC